MHATTLIPTEALRVDLATAQLHEPPSFFEGKTLADYCRLAFYAGKVVTSAVMDTADKIAGDFVRYINEPGLPHISTAEQPNQADSLIGFEEIFGEDDKLVNDLGRLAYHIGIIALDGVESTGNKVWERVRRFERPTLRKVVIWPFRVIGRVARGAVAIPGKMSSLINDRTPSDPVLARPSHSPAVDIRVNTHGPS